MDQRKCESTFRFLTPHAHACQIMVEWHRDCFSATESTAWTNFSKIGVRLGTSTWLTPGQPQSLRGRMMLGTLKEPERLFHLWPQWKTCLHRRYGLRYHPPCGGWRKGALERTRVGWSMTVPIESWSCWAWVTACLCPGCWRWGAAAANRGLLHVCLCFVFICGSYQAACVAFV